MSLHVCSMNGESDILLILTLTIVGGVIMCDENKTNGAGFKASGEKKTILRSISFTPGILTSKKGEMFNVVKVEDDEATATQDILRSYSDGSNIYQNRGILMFEKTNDLEPTII